MGYSPWDHKESDMTEMVQQSLWPGLDHKMTQSQNGLSYIKRAMSDSLSAGTQPRPSLSAYNIIYSMQRPSHRSLQGSYSPIAQRLTRTVALWQWGTELGMFVCCLSLEAGSLKLRCWQDHAPSEGTRGPALCLSQLLSPWCSLAGGSISPASACVSPWPGSPCACLCLPSPSVSLLFW